MRKDIAGEGSEFTTPTWESLEEFVRGRVQDLIQRVLEEEVTELLGREKSERREAVDAVVGYRNGYGKPRKLTMSSGTITLRRLQGRAWGRPYRESDNQPRRYRPGTLIRFPPPYSSTSNKIPSAASRSGVTRRSALTCRRVGARMATAGGVLLAKKRG